MRMQGGSKCQEESLNSVTDFVPNEFTPTSNIFTGQNMVSPVL